MIVAQLLPRRAGLDVDLDHAGVGRDDERAQARVARRRVALDHDRARQVGGRRLDDGEQLDRVLDVLERRQEDADASVAELDAERGRRRLVDLDDRRRRPRAASRAPAGRRAPRTASVRGRRAAADHVSESSGSRRPIGESPGIRNRRPRRSVHVVVRPARLPSGDGCSGSTNAVGSPTWSVESLDEPDRVRRRRRMSSSVRRRRVGRLAVGQPGLAPAAWSTGSSYAGEELVGSSPKAAAMPCASIVGVVERRRSRCRRVGEQVGSYHSGSPSSRQWMPSCQRGSGSPGYHLPWPWCSSATRRRSGHGRRLASAAARRPLVVAVGRGVPLGAVHVVDRHERRLAAHR